VSQVIFFMSGNYSQIRAMLAITKGSLIATFRSPSAVLFSIGFPLIFILVFGFIGGNGGPTYKVVLDKTGDTSNVVLDSLRKYSGIKFVSQNTDAGNESDLVKGRIVGILKIEKINVPNSNVDYLVHFRSTTASADKFSTFIPLLENIIARIDRVKFSERQTVAKVLPKIEQVREYRTIDFVLPGQLGFSLLSAGVFGVAFLFFNLRQQLVLKRFYATPIKRSYIILGEALSRVIFQLMTAIVIILIGTVAFHFTLVHGFLTFLEIMVLSFIALIVFMGCGFIVSGLAKNENTIPPFANLFTLPQFLLAGTFFSIDNFPKWMQPICNVLPLTHFNNAMRNIAFEGASLADCWKEIGILCIWGVIVYGIAVKTFKWE
jgi:ABC-2 type transport system permease protein